MWIHNALSDPLPHCVHAGPQGGLHRRTSACTQRGHLRCGEQGERPSAVARLRSLLSPLLTAAPASMLQDKGAVLTDVCKIISTQLGTELAEVRDRNATAAG